jgi:hypothetical protein
MKRKKWIIWSLLFAMLTLSGGAITTTRVNAQNPQPGDKAELAQNLIVKVIGDNVSGSGIVFGQMGEMLFIATANHVVRRGTQEAQNLRVGFKFWYQAIEAELLPPFDKELDLAVLLVDLKNNKLDSQALSQHLPLTQLSYVSDVQDGSNLYPVGHPPGADWYIPKPPPQLHEVEGESIRFHFQCDQGYFGGGLFNETWELVGMIVRFNPPVCEAISFERIQTALEKWRFMVSLKPPSPATISTGKTTSPTAPLTSRPTPPQIQLRSDPLTVSRYEAEKIFSLASDWRPLKYIENQFENKGDVVIDHATGLMWQQSGSSDPMEYEEAWLYIKQVNRERFAGYSDWRLPTVDELLSLMEPTEQAYGLSYINPIFDAMRQRKCWSADKEMPRSSRWFINFLDGSLQYNIPGADYYVRGVRSLQ